MATCSHQLHICRSIAVGIVTGYGSTEMLELESQKSKEFSLHHFIHTSSWTHPAFYPMGTGALSPVVKWPGHLADSHLQLANEFNKYFLSIAKNINTNQNYPNGHKLNTITPMHYLLQSFKTPFPDIKLKLLSSKKVENLIKSLKTKNSSGYDGIFIHSFIHSFIY
jgi:hypothetical protein